MRIAIVGAGISGLATAHLLHRAHEITVFEAGQAAGGHANTVRVDTEHATHHVDTGFIVFNDRNYPNFERLLASLGVASQPSDMSFGVSDGGDFEYNGSSPNGLFAKRAHLVTPWFHRMVADLVRFNRDARALLAAGGEGPSLGHWLDERALLAAVRGAADRARRRPPCGRPTRARCGRSRRASWSSSSPTTGCSGSPSDRSGGPWSAARARTSRRSFDRGRTGCGSNTPIRAIHRYDDHVDGHAARRRAGALRPGRARRATPTSRCAMLADASDREHEILGAIPYQPNEAVLHTDRRLLPRRRRAWASWNYHLLPEPTGMTTVTYHMNRLQALDADREFCVTLNRSKRSIREGPADVLLRAPRLHRRRRARPGAPRARSAASTAPTTRARTGAGASTRTASPARCASASTSGRACDVRGNDPPSALRRARARVPVPDRAGLPAISARPARLPQRAPRSRARPRGFDGEIRLLALPARLQPGRLLLLLRRRRAALDRRRGDEHAVGREARLRARRRGGTLDKAFHVSPFMAMDHTYEVRATAPGRDALDAHRVPPRRRARVRRDAEPAPAAADSAARCVGASLRTLP